MSDIDWSEHDVIVEFYLKGELLYGQDSHYFSICHNEDCDWPGGEFFGNWVSVQTLIDAKNEHDEFVRDNG